MADKPIRIDQYPAETVETTKPANLEGQGSQIVLELGLYGETETADCSQFLIELMLKAGPPLTSVPMFPEYRRQRK